MIQCMLCPAAHSDILGAGGPFDRASLSSCSDTVAEPRSLLFWCDACGAHPVMYITCIVKVLSPRASSVTMSLNECLFARPIQECCSKLASHGILLPICNHTDGVIQALTPGHTREDCRAFQNRCIASMHPVSSKWRWICAVQTLASLKGFRMLCSITNTICPLQSWEKPILSFYSQPS